MHVRQIVSALLLWAAAVAPAPAAEPAIGPPTVFATGIAGPEGIAATRTGDLVVGTVTGDVLRIDRAGATSLVASTGDRLAGVSVLKDGRIAACGFDQDRVWVIDADGTPTVLASGIDGPNFVAQERRRGRIFVSASFAGTIVDVTSGTPVVVASGLVFPNGLAIGTEGGRRFLYVAETLVHGVRRFFLNSDGTLGASEIYATGLTLADGLAFDRRGNLLVVGAGALSVVDRETRTVTPLTASAPLNWPSNIAFGRRGTGRRTMFLANFGPMLGDGTDVIAVPYSIRGARVIR
ncbi:MAG TPA: SMP-30/gluconolactonase/LRE family protein [Candidatus Limnocylindria bacterium]|nr:SMP-30/gluconolactonase/LRE family protein [Candidatus Limnocylindria bacterium]